MKNQFEKLTYNVSGREGYSLSTALRLWKTKYTDLKQFKSEVCKNEALEEFYNFVAEMWDDIKEVKVKEALQLKNTEDRRTYFDCIGPKRMFEQVKTKQLDRQVVKKKRARWDDKNKEYEYEFEDVYELYKIPYTELFEKAKESWMRQDDIFVVRCWCTTTGREYWLFVPENACTEREYSEKGTKVTYSAIGAIAWTIRTNVSKPERIYRQGDIIVVKASKDSVVSGWTRHLSKDDYLSLMYSET